MKTAKALFFAFLLVAASSVAAEDILTADQFFAKVSARYVLIDDYEGSVLITTGSQTMTGKLSFKSPSLLRIDFSRPAEQVILFDGSRLVVYIPEYRAVLQQEAGDSGVGAAALASREGLAMMKRSYTMAWETSPAPVPLDAGSAEQVMRLVLNRRSVSEGFRTIKLSISPDSLLIRRIEGWTVANERVAFDLSGIKTNQGIPANRFLYDAPASANVYNNFLFQ
ncbi:MAG: outer-membrane lipoprotein carrier protein LolA [Rectinemataceae bacterium]